MLNIELTDQEAQPVLFIRTRTSMAQLPQVIGSAYGKIMQYLNEIGAAPADAPYTAYYNMDMDDLDVEMGFPIDRQLPGREEIDFRVIEAGKYLSCLYTGPYSGMEEPYNKMAKWIEDNNCQATGISYEYYYNDPGSVPESELITKIVMPVVMVGK